jgi:hypothetical protein
MDATTLTEWRKIIASMMIFFKGSFNYRDLFEMPIPELLDWYNIAININNEISKEIERKSRR